MVGQLGKLFEEINKFDTDQETKDAYEHIYSSVRGRYLNHLQYTKRLHATKSNHFTGPERTPPTSPTYLPGTELMASPSRPSTPAALSTDEDT
jgi:hypothetical protein